MASTLDFIVKMSLALNGNFKAEFSKANQLMSDMQKKTQSLQALSSKVTGFQKTSQSLEQSRLKLAQTQEKIKTLRYEIAHTDKPSQALKKSFTQANEEAARLRGIVHDNMRSLGDYRNALTAAGVDVKNLAGAQDKLKLNLDRVNAAQQRLSNAQAKYNNILGQLSWDNMKGDILKSAGTLMTLKQPVIVDMEFEQAMANVKAVMNPLKEEFEALRNQALELGRTTQFSASQAANSQENLARAGFTSTQIIQTMPGLLSMAAAEGMDLAQAATILAGGLRGMNLDMSQSMRLADAFAYTSSHSATNITNLGEAFKAVAATASLQGASPEQLLSYLGVLANLQVEGGEAGNAVTSAFMRLSNPAKEAQKVFKQFGIQVVKNGRMRELGNLLEELYKKTEKLGAAEQLKAFSIVFGKNYGDSLIKLARGVVSGDQEKLLQGLLKEKTGASDQMAAMRNDTLKGDLTALSSAWEGFNIAIGYPLQNEIRKIVQALTLAISTVTEFIDKNKELIQPVIKIGAAFATWSVIATVFKYAKLIVSLPFAKLNVLLAESAAKSALAGQHFSLLSSLMYALSHPVAALKSAFSGLWGVIAAHPFMAIIAVASALYVYWDDLYALWQKSLNWISDKWQWLKDFWEMLEIPNIFAELENYCNEIITKIKTAWQDFCNWIAGLNPFKNWGAPAVKSVNIGGVQHDTGGSKQVENALRALDGFATGGIVHNHSVIQVAEKGPEMIIPLKDKSRGLSLWTQTAGILGVNLQRNNRDNVFSSHAARLNWPESNARFSPNNDSLNAGNMLSQLNGIMNWPESNSRFSPNNDSFNAGNMLSRLDGIMNWPESSQTVSNANSSQNNVSVHNFLSTAKSLLNGLIERNIFNSETVNQNSIANNFSEMSARPNLTFNISVSGDSDDLAQRIARAVRNAIDNLHEYELRVAYE